MSDQFNLLLGYFAIEFGTSLTAKLCNVTRGRTGYYKKKALLPYWHGRNRGRIPGFSAKWTVEEMSTIKWFLWWKCQKNPCSRLGQYVKSLRNKVNMNVSRSTITRI